jgi:hypothetical protein
MADFNFKEKYLKYKKKYLDLKEFNSKKIGTSNKVLLIKFNSKKGGGQDLFQIYSKDGKPYNLYMFDKRNEELYSETVRKIVSSNQEDFNEETWSFSGTEGRAHDSINEILKYDYACFLTDPDYVYRNGREKIIGYIKATIVNSSDGEVPLHIYIDYVELRKYTNERNPHGQSKGLCKPMLGRFMQWLYTKHMYTYFKIFNASQYGLSARSCYTNASDEQFSYGWKIADDWGGIHSPKMLEAEEPGDEFIFMKVNEDEDEERKYSLVFAHYGSLFTYEEFVDFFGSEYVQEKWDSALPEHRYSNVQGHHDELYTLDEFRDYWKEDAIYQWSIARIVEEDDKKNGHTFLYHMQTYGQRNGIDCWNGVYCITGGPQIELRYSPFPEDEDRLFSLNDFRKVGVGHLWDGARQNNVPLILGDL